MGFSQFFAVQSACSQTHHRHVTDPRMSISDTGQNLAEKQCLINVDMEQQKQTDILEESVNDNEDTIP